MLNFATGQPEHREGKHRDFSCHSTGSPGTHSCSTAVNLLERDWQVWHLVTTSVLNGKKLWQFRVGWKSVCVPSFHSHTCELKGSRTPYFQSQTQHNGIVAGSRSSLKKTGWGIKGAWLWKCIHWHGEPGLKFVEERSRPYTSNRITRAVTHQFPVQQLVFGLALCECTTTFCLLCWNTAKWPMWLGWVMLCSKWFLGYTFRTLTKLMPDSSWSIQNDRLLCLYATQPIWAHFILHFHFFYYVANSSPYQMQASIDWNPCKQKQLIWVNFVFALHSSDHLFAFKCVF